MMHPRIAQELVAIAKLIAKARPSTLFEQAFFDIREKAKEMKKKMGKQAVGKLTKLLTDDLKSKGVIIQSADIKLGKFRGSQFVTSAKLYVTAKEPYVDVNDKRLTDMLAYLQQTYSPKYKLKKVDDGVAIYNVR
jgi:hypothetical protein